MSTEQNNIFEYYSLVKTTKINWLWYPYIPFGKLTVIQGDPGDGKSTFILDIISRLTRGSEMPDGYKINDSYNVVYQCFEDDISDTIKPRLESAGADCNKVAYIKNSNNLNINDNIIETAIKDINAKLLVLDPIQSFLQDTDLNSANGVRSILSNLVRIAKEYGCAIVLIGHLNKSGSSKNIYRGLGSIDITAIARSVLMIERDEGNPQIRYIYPIKSSLAAEGEAIGFQIVNKKIKWICEKVPLKKHTACKELLVNFLNDGAMHSSIIMELIKNKGFSERKINAEKKKLGIKSIRKNGKWYWLLPNETVSLEAGNE